MVRRSSLAQTARVGRHWWGESRSKNGQGCGTDTSILERDEICEFGDERPIEQVARSLIAALVVHQEEIAQRPVNDVEPEVRAPLLRVGVVLQQRIDEDLRVEVVIHPPGHQRRYEQTG